jgi:hypothetical protein
MAVSFSTPVTVIEGIGPALAARLRPAGVSSVLDLLRVSPTLLASLLGGPNAQERILRWRAMATLMQVEEIGPQWAEALVRGGVPTLDALASRGVSQLSALFQAAVQQNIIPTAPDVDTLGAMKADAAILTHTGSLSGRVTEPEGEPLAGAAVQLGYLRESTGESGRFRLLRIPLHWRAPLLITCPGFQTVGIEQPAIQGDAGHLLQQPFTLEPVAGDDSPPDPILSQLAGDTLPEIRGQPVRAERIDPPELQENDLLILQRFFQRTPDVELSSRLRDYQAGRIRVRTYKLPVAGLPPGASVGDHFRVRQGRLVPVEVTPGYLDFYRKKLRLDRTAPDLPAPTGEAEVRQRFEEDLARLLDGS